MPRGPGWTRSPSARPLARCRQSSFRLTGQSRLILRITRGRGPGPEELLPGFAAGAFETADGLFVATDLGGDGFEATAQLVDLDGLAGQGSGVAIADAVLVDNGVQVGPPVEDDPADPGAGGYFGERDCCPAAASSAQAASTRACSSWSAGTGVGDEQVEPVDEARVPGGFGAPAAGGGVGGERFGVGPLQLHDQQEAGVGMEVRTMLADVGVGAGALGGGAQAIAVDQPGLDQRRVPPVAAGDDGQLQLGPVAGQQGAELGQG